MAERDRDPRARFFGTKVKRVAREAWQTSRLCCAPRRRRSPRRRRRYPPPKTAAQKLRRPSLIRTGTNFTVGERTSCLNWPSHDTQTSAEHVMRQLTKVSRGRVERHSGPGRFVSVGWTNTLLKTSQFKRICPTQTQGCTIPTRASNRASSRRMYAQDTQLLPAPDRWPTQRARAAASKRAKSNSWFPRY